MAVSKSANGSGVDLMLAFERSKEGQKPTSMSGKPSISLAGQPAICPRKQSGARVFVHCSGLEPTGEEHVHVSSRMT